MAADDGIGEDALRHRLTQAGLSIAGNRVIINRDKGYRELVFELRQFHLPGEMATPAVVAELAGESGVMKLRWDGLR